jgi:hypothetical protein
MMYKRMTGGFTLFAQLTAQSQSLYTQSAFYSSLGDPYAESMC